MAPILSRLGQAFGFGASAGADPPSPVQASGGTETSPFPGGDGNFYKAHVFKAGGSFIISKLSTSDKPSDINWFIIGGGGAGGANRGGGGYGGGGGAGGAMSDMPFMPAPFRGAQADVAWAAGTWQVSLGGGGQGRPGNQPSTNGGATSFYKVGSPTIGLSAPGGGRGGNEGGPGHNGGCGGGGCAGPSGGSGGAGGYTPGPGGSPVPKVKGGNGSPAGGNDNAAGGGGGVMDEGNRPHGGAGIPLRGMVCHPTTSIPPICGYAGPPSSPDGPFGGWVGGGGGSGNSGRGGNPGGGGPGTLRYAGGGTGPAPNDANSKGQDNSGGGAGGGGESPLTDRNGGTGLAIFRYQVDS